MNHDETTNDANEITTTAERDERGRFLPGNAVARGNPHGPAVQKMRSALIEQLVADDEACFRGVVKSMIAKALRGDVAAGRLVLEYSLGRPQSSITVETEHGPAFRIVTGIDGDAL